VERFLHGLLQDLERRCSTLRDRLATIPVDQEVRSYAMSTYQEAERIRRRVAQLLADPSLSSPLLLSNHLQLYKRLNERVRVIESFPFLFVERYAEPDRRITRFCQRLTEQIGWPLSAPLVATFSHQYYWTVAEFNLVCTPGIEGMLLLSQPDLCHELGHILLLAYKALFLEDFLHILEHYILEEQRRVDTGQRPLQYRPLYEVLLMQWKDAWVLEFVADMIATYLVGPAFGWQHLRLCTGNSRTVYYPGLSDIAEHPADEARFRGIIAVLEQIGALEAVDRIQTLWDNYLAACGETLPPDYEVCYPQTLIEALAQRTIEVCRTLSLRSFNASNSTGGNIPSLLNEAWERFLNDPQAYADWERSQLEMLWRDLGFNAL
jgi:hypothetical protein